MYGELDALVEAVRHTTSDLLFVTDNDWVHRGYVSKWWLRRDTRPSRGPHGLRWVEQWRELGKALALGPQRQVIVTKVGSHAEAQDLQQGYIGELAFYGNAVADESAGVMAKLVAPTDLEAGNFLRDRRRAELVQERIGMALAQAIAAGEDTRVQRLPTVKRKRPRLRKLLEEVGRVLQQQCQTRLH